jgi:hypothetical protein
MEQNFRLPLYNNYLISEGSITIVEPNDPAMVNMLKKKVLDLSEACRASAVTYKQARMD